MLQLTEMQSQGHTIDPSSLPNIDTVHNRACPPYQTELDDDPINIKTLLINPNIPYLHVIALPTHSLLIHGLTLPASRHVRGTVNTPEDLIHPSIT